MRHISIIGYGTSIGKRKLRFGNQQRHRIGEDQSHISLAIEAVERALRKGNLAIDDMDVIVFASAIGFQPIPCSAALISEKLEPARPIPCIDINTSCTSFVAAMDLISHAIAAGQYEKALIVTAEVPSIGLNEDQQESYELFSDAGAAFILSREESSQGILYAMQQTWSKGAHDTEIRGGLSNKPAQNYNADNRGDFLFDMKGKSALFLAMQSIQDFCRSFEKASGLKLKEMDLVIPHQASKALPMVMKKLGICQSRYLNKIEELGNMVAVSIPYLLCLALEEKHIHKEDRVLLLGTAAGLSINALALQF